jgi:hypothetical protein
VRVDFRDEKFTFEEAGAAEARPAEEEQPPAVH